MRTSIYSCTFHLGSRIVGATRNACVLYDCRQKFSRWWSAFRKTVGKQKWWFCDPCARINSCKWRLTVREISAEDGIPYGTCQAILTEDLNMWRISAKFLHRVVTIEQKQQRLSLRGRNGSELRWRHHHRWTDICLWTLSGKKFRKTHLKKFPTMPEPLAEAHSFRRSLFWRGLSVYICKK